MNKISRLWALVITISVLALGAVVANSNSPSSAEGGCAGKAYVVNFNADTVSVIDTATNAVVGSAIPVGSEPFGIAICPAAVVPPTTPTDPAVVLKFTG
jgi:YVTN family beta-propeller protein